MNSLHNIFSNVELDRFKKLIQLSIEDGSIFPNWEFSILTGAQLDEAKQVCKNWPQVDLGDEGVYLVLRGILANVIGYPHKNWIQIHSRTSLNEASIRDFKQRLDKTWIAN